MKTLLVFGWLLLPVQSAAQAWGTLRGTVVGEDTAPVVEARIRIVGTDRTALSGKDGRFELTRVAPGDRILEVRLLGYRRLVQMVNLAPGETLHVQVVLAAAPLPLEPVEITGEPTPPAMRGFEERRAKGYGHFFNRQEIVRMQPRVFTDVLRRVPGVQIQPTPGSVGSGDMVRMTRTAGVSGARACPVLFFLNGTPFPVTADISINQYVIPEDVVAIEVYNGSSQIPPQFLANELNARCGVIAIWTRVGNEDKRAPEPVKQ